MSKELVTGSSFVSSGERWTIMRGDGKKTEGKASMARLWLGISRRNIMSHLSLLRSFSIYPARIAWSFGKACQTLADTDSLLENCTLFWHTHTHTQSINQSDPLIVCAAFRKIHTHLSRPEYSHRFTLYLSIIIDRDVFLNSNSTR